MRLARFRVEGLFGLFTHEIKFNLDRQITIVHAPNGYGKTVILKFIEGMFGGSLGVFRQHDFKNIVFEMDDGSTATVDKFGAPPDMFGKERPEGARHYRIQLQRPGQLPSEWDPISGRSPEELRREVPASMIERAVPFLFREGGRVWRDTRSGELLTHEGVLERYADYFPPGVRRAAHPEWLDQFRASLHCQLIETQRLMIQRSDGRYERDQSGALTPTVKTYAENLSTRMGAALAESATLSQSLDRTFPNRLLGRMSDSRPPLSEEELRRDLADLEQRRARLTRADLLDKSDESALIPGERFNEETRRILTEYVGDAKRKLDVYDDLLGRIELFTRILSEKFQFKTVSADRRKGFVLRDITGREVAPDSLSSGEQHELVLMYDLLFKTKPGTLIMIDEPEISLHIAWQKKFLDDILQIINLNPMDVVLSTHSPQLIGANLDLAVKLSGPRDVSARV